MDLRKRRSRSCSAQQPFYYTLTPPKLADNSVARIPCSTTKRGLLAATMLGVCDPDARAGIPARVVTGYQGGTFNRFATIGFCGKATRMPGTEILDRPGAGAGIDPRRQSLPNRVERGLSDAVSADGPLSASWATRTPWLADLAASRCLRQLWRERILLFDQDSQQKVLEWLNIPEPAAKSW